MTDLQKTREVHVYLWSIRLESVQQPLTELAACLAEDERERAARFRFAEHRTRFVKARAFLRNLLSVHQGVEPEQIQFRTMPNGKPQLDVSNSPGFGWQFNLSRSGPFVICGVVQHRRIGVDVECHKDMSDMQSVARAIFSDVDYDHWDSIAASLRPESFFRAWARKEARGKADGSGISNGVANIHVPLEPFGTDSFRVIPVQDDCKNEAWCLSDWNAFGDASAAVVIEAMPGESFCAFRDEPAGSRHVIGGEPAADRSLLQQARLQVRTFFVDISAGFGK